MQTALNTYIGQPQGENQGAAKKGELFLFFCIFEFVAFTLTDFLKTLPSLKNEKRN